MIFVRKTVSAYMYCVYLIKEIHTTVMIVNTLGCKQ